MGWFDVVKVDSSLEFFNVLNDIGDYLNSMANFGEKLVFTPKRDESTKEFSSVPEEWGPISTTVEEYRENLDDYTRKLKNLLTEQRIPNSAVAKGIREWLMGFDWEAMQRNVMELYHQRKSEFPNNPYFKGREGELTFPSPLNWDYVERVLTSPDLDAGDSISGARVTRR